MKYKCSLCNKLFFIKNKENKIVIKTSQRPVITITGGKDINVICSRCNRETKFNIEENNNGK